MTSHGHENSHGHVNAPSCPFCGASGTRDAWNRPWKGVDPAKLRGGYILKDGETFERDVLPIRCRAKYQQHIETIRKVAREHGYAIGVHGSIRRDIDLIAAPWTDEASDGETLARAIAGAVEGVIDMGSVPGRAKSDDHERPEAKPHGRMCWSIHLGGGPYIDLSVMTLATPASDPCDDWSNAFNSFSAGQEWGRKNPDCGDEGTIDACIAHADRVAPHECPSQAEQCPTCGGPTAPDGDRFRCTNDECGTLMEIVPAPEETEAQRLRYATRFTLHDGPVTLADNPVSIEVRDGIGPNLKEVRRWVVTRRGYVWSKFAQAFVDEPIPSYRTDEFIAETRFDSLDEAWNVALIAANGGRS